MSLAIASRPGRLLAAGPAAGYATHLERYGLLPSAASNADALLDEIDASGLSGRGGGGFPTARKLRAVAGCRRAIVVANGAEGEPASAKDKVLLAASPQLVLDGVLTAAALVGAEESVIAVGRHGGAARAALETALAERGGAAARRIRIESVPDRFVAGEESALVAWLNGHDAKPTLTPPRPSDRGVRGRPTLVQNVETLANLALIARFGADWFRERESVLVTVLGAVRRPGVIEVELGTPICDVLDRCGGMSERVRAFLIGGYFGTWIDAQGASDLPLSNAALAPLGAALGARTLVALPRTSCGLAETARIASYLAEETAGQCGPCVFGLPAVARCLQAICHGGHDARHALDRLPRLFAQIRGRGACAHPDGAIRFVESALRIFHAEISLHVNGTCNGDHQPLLPVPPATDEWR